MSRRREDDYYDDRNKRKKYDHDRYDDKYDRRDSHHDRNDRHDRRRDDNDRHDKRYDDYDRKGGKPSHHDRKEPSASKEVPLDDKKQKLEAFKKKLEENKILEKLKQQTTVTPPPTNILAEEATVLPENEKLDMIAPPTVEIDPLDAFMEGIDQEVKKLEEQDKIKEKIRNMTTWDEEDDIFLPEQDQQDPDYHIKFKEALKSKEPQILINNEDDEGYLLDSYMKLPEDEDEVEVDVDKKTKSKKDLKQVDHSQIQYLPVKKSFFIVPKELQNLSQEELDKMRLEKENIKVNGKDIPAPISTWNQCGLSDTVLKILSENGFEEPFAIQCQALPCIMSGRDVLAAAKTGSGKTLAFLLPMFRHILDQVGKYPLQEGIDGPIGLILAPTRELCVQIFDEVVKFSSLGLRAACAYGGVSISDQISLLKRAPHIVVATPGRFIDLLCANHGRVTNLTRVSFVVLDEADRQFDQGFMPQIMRILNNIRPDKQICMFSATFPKPLEALAKKTMTNPIEIIVGGRSIVSENVKQFVEITTEETKFLRLLELLGKWYEKGQILIFTEKQTDADTLFRDLISSGYDPLLLHGAMEQLERTHTLSQFKGRIKNVLVATSVAARGLDVKGLKLVINYTCPSYREDYVHRIGRTGRAKKKGTAYTFIDASEEHLAPELVKALKQSKSTIPSDLQEMSNQYLEKKKKGLTDNKVIRGYSGRGHEFTEKEVSKKDQEMKRQKQIMEAEENGEDVPVKPISGESDPTLILTQAKKFAEMLSVQNAPSEKGHYTADVEINDYVQSVRARMTQKDTIYEMAEYSSTTITCKGSYIPPGIKVPPGERKLYLLIEATTREALERGKSQVSQMLRQLVKDAEPEATSKLTVGKYTVL